MLVRGSAAMSTSFERVANDQLEAPNALQLNSAGALENDSDLAGELRDLIRLARQRRLGRPHGQSCSCE
jgi:hypothetical protein